MEQYFAMAKVDNSFIVKADSEPELGQKIDEIKSKYRDYYKSIVKPGFYVVKAHSLKEAKAKQRELIN